MSQKVGQVTGKVLGAKNQFRANIKYRKDQLHDLPTTAQYAVMKGKEQLTKPSRDFKEGIKQAKEKRQKANTAREAKHRQTIADRRQALDKKRTPSREFVSPKRPVTQKGNESLHQDRLKKPPVQEKQKTKPVTIGEHRKPTKLQQRLSSPHRKEHLIETDHSKQPVKKGNHLSKKNVPD